VRFLAMSAPSGPNLVPKNNMAWDGRTEIDDGEQEREKVAYLLVISNHRRPVANGKNR
jgi:hypothetical protein